MIWKIMYWVIWILIIVAVLSMCSSMEAKPPMVCSEPAALVFAPEWARSPHGLGELQVGDVTLRRGVAWVWQ